MGGLPRRLRLLLLAALRAGHRPGGRPGSAAWTRTWCGPWPDAFAAGYQPPGPDTPDNWFDQIRRLAADLGFAPSQKVYKQDPAAYRGSIPEASQVIRVLLTGTRRSPELAEVARALGTDEVLRRVRAVSAS